MYERCARRLLAVSERLYAIRAARAARLRTRADFFVDEDEEVAGGLRLGAAKAHICLRLSGVPAVTKILVLVRNTVYKISILFIL